MGNCTEVTISVRFERGFEQADEPAVGRNLPPIRNHGCIKTKYGRRIIRGRVVVCDRTADNAEIADLRVGDAGGQRRKRLASFLGEAANRATVACRVMAPNENRLCWFPPCLTAPQILYIYQHRRRVQAVLPRRQQRLSARQNLRIGIGTKHGYRFVEAGLHACSRMVAFSGRPRGSHRGAAGYHGVDDVQVTGAAAEIAVQFVADGFRSHFLFVARDSERHHNHARRAEPALQRVMVDKCPLHRNGVRLDGATPSIVVTDCPLVCATSTVQDLIALPSTCTVQQPH